MADVDETAKLWKVNRTIHELVKDRVSCDWDLSRDNLESSSHYSSLRVSDGEIHADLQCFRKLFTNYSGVVPVVCVFSYILLNGFGILRGHNQLNFYTTTRRVRKTQPINFLYFSRRNGVWAWKQWESELNKFNYKTILWPGQIAWYSRREIDPSRFPVITLSARKVCHHSKLPTHSLI